jgi:lipase chaperone LimK
MAELEFPVSRAHRDALERLRAQRLRDASRKAVCLRVQRAVREQQAELAQRDVLLQGLAALQHAQAGESELRQAGRRLQGRRASQRVARL